MPVNKPKSRHTKPTKHNGVLGATCPTSDNCESEFFLRPAAEVNRTRAIEICEAVLMRLKCKKEVPEQWNQELYGCIQGAEEVLHSC